MSFTCSMPSAEMDFTCCGSGLPSMFASRAGIRLSRAMVVFPLPDIPVTTVNLPLGIFTSSGLTVWIRFVFISMVPRSNIFSAGVRGRSPGLPSSRKGPMIDFGFFSRSSTVPSAMMLPPSAPALGPSSTIQSERRRICVSWSTNTIEFPSAIRASMTPMRPSMLEGWRPMDGSSRTYSTPVVLLRTDLAI